MIYKEYGKTGIKVSAVGFGGMRFDEKKSNEENAELLLYAKEKGSNYFDMERDALIFDNGLVLFGDGDNVMVTTAEEPVRFLLISGKPIGEPIAWQGPIVMNTREELQLAFTEYHNGTFIKEQTP